MVKFVSLIEIVYIAEREFIDKFSENEMKKNTNKKSIIRKFPSNKIVFLILIFIMRIN